MSDEPIDNRNDYSRPAYVDPRSIGKGGGLLINRRPETKVPFQQVLDQVKAGSPADTFGLPNTTPRTAEANPAQTPVQQVTPQHHEERSQSFREALNKRYRDNDSPH